MAVAGIGDPGHKRILQRPASMDAGYRSITVYADFSIGAPTLLPHSVQEPS
jgi:hypothetical protein